VQQFVLRRTIEVFEDQRSLRAMQQLEGGAFSGIVKIRKQFSDVGRLPHVQNFAQRLPVASIDQFTNLGE
jgi:hypothetical protein